MTPSLSSSWARHRYVAHLRALLILGMPLIGSNIAQFALHVVDTIMLGWYGVNELAAVVLGAGLFFTFFILGSGFSYALLGRVSQALGRGDTVQVRRDTRMTIWLVAIFSVLVLPVLWHAEAIFRALGQTEHIASLAASFVRIAMFGMLPALLVAVIKSFLSAFERTRVVLIVTLGAVVVNIALNWLLIFGNLGFPEMGLRGAATASVAVQVLTALALLAYTAVLPSLRRFDLFVRIWKPDWSAFFAVARVGLPIGITSVCESALFQGAAIMMGWIGTVELAAHGITMQIVSLMFMVHIGFSNAATVRAGWAHGAHDIAGLRDGALVALICSLAFSAITIVFFLAIPHTLLGLFIDQGNPAAAHIIQVGTVLLAVAGVFQVFDATQVMALGLLRGMQDTRVPMWIAACSYWLVGIPAGYVLAFVFNFGAAGIWSGLVFGLGCAASILIVRFWRGPWLQPHR